MDAIVLAAGSGARMGAAKGRLLIDDVPLALHHVRSARAAGCRRVVIVASPPDVPWLERELRREAPSDTPVRVVPSTAAEQAGSLALGVRALRETVPGGGEDVTLVTPVDTLPATLTTITALLGGLSRGALAATPRCGDRGGHPALVRTSVLSAYLPTSLPGAARAPSLRELLASLGDRRVRVAVIDPAVVTDLDTPDDVSRLTGAPPRFRSQS